MPLNLVWLFGGFFFFLKNCCGELLDKKKEKKEGKQPKMSVLTRTKGTGGKLRNVRHKCNTNDITAISVLLGREFQVLGRKMMILLWGFF